MADQQWEALRRLREFAEAQRAKWRNESNQATARNIKTACAMAAGSFGVVIGEIDKIRREIEAVAENTKESTS